MSVEITCDHFVNLPDRPKHFRILVSDYEPDGALYCQSKNSYHPGWYRHAEHSVFTNFLEYLSSVCVSDELLMDWLAMKTDTRTFRRQLRQLHGFFKEACALKDKARREYLKSAYPVAVSKQKDEAWDLYHQLSKLGVVAPNPYDARKHYWPDIRKNEDIESLRTSLQPNSVEMAILEAYSAHGFNSTAMLSALDSIIQSNIGEDSGRINLGHMIAEIRIQSDLAVDVGCEPPDAGKWAIDALNAYVYKNTSELKRLQYCDEDLYDERGY